MPAVPLDAKTIQEQKTQSLKLLDSQVTMTKDRAKVEYEAQKQSITMNGDHQFAVASATIEQSKQQALFALEQQNSTRKMEIEQRAQEQRMQIEATAAQLTMQAQQQKLEREMQKKQLAMQQQLQQQQQQLAAQTNQFNNMPSQPQYFGNFNQ